MRAAAIGLNAVAAAVALAGAPAARATAALRHERVPFQLIQRFPLNPRPVPAASPTPAARTPVAMPLKRDSGGGVGLPLAWLLLPVGCACLVVGVWIARRRASPARASRHPRREGQASARSTFQRGWSTRRRRCDRFIPLQQSRSNGHESVGLERQADLGVAAEAQKDMAGTEAANRCAAEPGDAAGAFNLGVLLEQRGELDAAMAAYRRADQRGDAAGAFRLGLLLEERGQLAKARAAYGRAALRGDGVRAKMARAALLDLGGGFQLAKEPQTTEPQTGGQVATRQRAVRASRARQRTSPGSTKIRVLAALADGKAQTAGEVASTIGLARGTVSTTLSRLAQRGEVLKAERGYRLPASSETDGPGTVASQPERPPT
jgi:DNA-binding transcriptional ArsR family regulator